MQLHRAALFAAQPFMLHETTQRDLARPSCIMLGLQAAQSNKAAASQHSNLDELTNALLCYFAAGMAGREREIKVSTAQAIARSVAQSCGPLPVK